MPLASFSKGLRDVIMFLPGTYGTSLIRNHALDGVFKEMERTNVPEHAIEGIKNSIDCNIYYFEDKVSVGAMYLVLGLTVALLITAYVLINALSKKKN
jgi:multidrug/hemolysin transport system permease protein